MAYYGVIYPEFWTGKTGRALRSRGKDAQLLALYLLSSPHANMIGLYHLPPVYIREESGLTARAIAAASITLQVEEFASYDPDTEFVWVREMARFRMNLSPDRPALEKGDLKTKGAQRLYEGLPPNPWLSPFFDRYGKALHLRKRREGPLYVGLRSPFEAPSKPVTGSESVSVTGSDTDKSTGAFAPGNSPAVENRPSHALLCRLLHDVQQKHPTYGYADQADALKTSCAQLELVPRPDDITKALEACDPVLRRRKRSA